MLTNLERLERVAQRLEPLLDELTLVGGSAVGLVISDPAADPPRPTEDVDFAVMAARNVEFHELERRLRRLGFDDPAHDADPIGRLRSGELVIDVTSADENANGFSNRWYRSAIEHRVAARLPGGIRIHHVDAPHFIATKLEAFADRGGGDLVGSHDVEDIVRTIDGRPTIVSETRVAPRELQDFVAERLGKFLTDRWFLEALGAYFRDPQIGARRARIVEARLRQLTHPGQS
ncbi:MAG: nucleotidyl transferase AbiEii/AbiGii toxin family protein [Planctomycetota bacterium]|nr:nucleotidyl transferase AbiEii/AbiGii toxin family protein [Planctomycetota bacterium]